MEAQIPAGDHRLEASRAGYETKSFAIRLAEGDARRVDVQLDRPPLTHRWWFWAGAAAVATAGAVLTTALLTERSPDEGRAFAPSQQLRGP